MQTFSSSAHMDMVKLVWQKGERWHFRGKQGSLRELVLGVVVGPWCPVHYTLFVAQTRSVMAHTGYNFYINNSTQSMVCVF